MRTKMNNTAHHPFATRIARGLQYAALVGALALSCANAAAPANTSSMVLKGKDGWLFGGWGSLTKVNIAGIDTSVDLVSRVNQLLAAKNIKLQVLLLPDKVHFYTDKLPEGSTVSPEVKQRYTLILGKLQQAGVSTFDDYTVMQNVQKSGSEVFYKTDQHWTQEAADATAQATADMIKRDVPQLAGAAGTGTPLGAVTKERRYGDLAELFLTPEEKKAVGREIYVVRRQAENQSLLDDAPAPVHVTGHSMVQPYFGFPQKLSNVLDRPVSLNWKPGNIGPWVMLLEYVESPAFTQNKPQVLVWQMFEPNFEQNPNAAGLWDNASVMPNDTWLQRVTSAIQK